MLAPQLIFQVKEKYTEHGLDCIYVMTHIQCFVEPIMFNTGNNVGIYGHALSWCRHPQDGYSSSHFCWICSARIFKTVNYCMQWHFMLVNHSIVVEEGNQKLTLTFPIKLWYQRTKEGFGVRDGGVFQTALTSLLLGS